MDLRLLQEVFFDYFSGPNYWGIQENFFDYTKCIRGDFYTYVNPTIDEIKKFIATGSRGFISPTGDLYMEGYEENRELGDITHSNFFRSLENKGIITPEYAINWFTRHSEESIKREGIAVQRVRHSNKIALSESYLYYKDEYRRSVQMLFDMCKRQGNTYWEFLPIKISYLEP